MTRARDARVSPDSGGQKVGHWQHLRTFGSNKVGRGAALIRLFTTFSLDGSLFLRNKPNFGFLQLCL
jgi:hypothetical protein